MSTALRNLRLYAAKYRLAMKRHVGDLVYEDIEIKFHWHSNSFRVDLCWFGVRMTEHYRMEELLGTRSSPEIRAEKDAIEHYYKLYRALKDTLSRREDVWLADDREMLPLRVCSECTYKQPALQKEGFHCYMFRGEPDGATCGQFTPITIHSKKEDSQ